MTEAAQRRITALTLASQIEGDAARADGSYQSARVLSVAKGFEDYLRDGASSEPK